MTLDELTAYLEKQGFMRHVEEAKVEPEQAAEPEQAEPEPQNNFATKDDFTQLQNALAELSQTIKANNINTQFIENPKQDSAEDILASVLTGKGVKD